MTSALPVVSQFLSVKLIPFQHRIQCPTRKLARHDSCFNIDRNLVLAIFRVEMCRWVLTVVEINDDSEKPADFGHE